MPKRDYQRESARRIIWTDRESLLPHLLEHRHCGVYGAVEELCATAGWTMDSYLIAALFDREELLVEVTK
jgi:hypothetical protein